MDKIVREALKYDIDKMVRWKIPPADRESLRRKGVPERYYRWVFSD